MFVRMLGLGVPTALGGLWVTGAFGGATADGQVFDVPAATVYQRLSTMTIPSELRQGADGGVQVEREPDSVIRWKLMSKGYEGLRVTATITPLADGKAAAVATEIQFTETGPEGAQGKKLNDMETVKAIGGILLDEQVAATVEARPFDMKAVKMKAGAYALANRGALLAEAKQIQAMMEEGSALASSGLGGGYDEWNEFASDARPATSRASRPTFETGEPMSSTRPMVDVSSSRY